MHAIPEGQCVRHSQYGLGVVTQSDAERTSIDFQLFGPKKFATQIMTVEFSDEVIPPKPPATKRRKKAIATPSQA